MSSNVESTADLPSAAVLRRESLIVFALVFLFALSFALFTNHAWEDFYITYRCSKNFATGNGLVFTPGERVHAFTSPLNTLLPALFCVATGAKSDAMVLWMYRILCCIALASAAVILLRLARLTHLGKFVSLALVAMFALDAKTVDYSINGQETALMVFFLALALRAQLGPTRRAPLVLGLAWAGLMWTRPDAFIYFGSIAAGVWVFNAADPSVASSRKALVSLYLKAGLLCALLYLPWFAWAWSYYGSPIPHTITAKSVLVQKPSILYILLSLISFPLRAIASGNSVTLTFLPAAYTFGDWLSDLRAFGTILGCLAIFSFVLPKSGPKTRALSLAFFMCEFYLTAFTPLTGWYMPNAAIIGFVTLAYFVHGRMVASAGQPQPVEPARLKIRHQWIKAAVVIFLVANLGITSLVAWQMRTQQRIIEDGVRTKIGLWLKEHAASSRDTVFLEPLGYIGFYSQLKMLDYPGLCSPEVVKARQNGQGTWPEIVAQLKPDWLVLRPIETNRFNENGSDMLQKDYMLEQVFDASKEVANVPFLPGRFYLEWDQTFLVFRRVVP